MKGSATSLKTKLKRIILLLVICTASIVAISAIVSMIGTYKKVNLEMKNALMKNSEKNLKYHVESVAALIDKYTENVKDGHISKELKRKIDFIIQNTNYNQGEDYFFINDFRGNVIVNGSQENFKHQYLISNRGAINEKLSHLAVNGGGFLTYPWLKPNESDKQFYPKLSYVQSLKNVPWYIGSGVYVNDVDRFIDKQIEEQSASLRVFVFQFVVFSIALMMITLLVSIYFSNRFSKPIIQFANLAKKISEGDFTVKFSEKYNDELDVMAESFNTMTKNIANKIKKLTYEEQYIRHLFESVADGIVVTDTHHKIVQVNSAMTNIFEASEEELLSSNINLFLPIQNMGFQKTSSLDEVLAGKTIANFNVIRRKKDGSDRYLSVAISPVHEDNDSIQLIIYSIKDETEQHLLENKLEKMNNLKKYFTPHVVEEIMSGKNDVTMDYSRKKVTIFFSDLVGFSDLSDNLEAEELTTILGEYLTSMSYIVYKYSGTLDKYIGDAVMVFFGAPTSNGVGADAVNCINMALEMRSQLDELNKKWKLDTPLAMRMGINTGFATVGNFGSEFRLEYTVIGAPVNIAARLEQSCPVNSILISHETAQYVQDSFSLVEGALLHLKGFHHPVKTYQVVGPLKAN